MAGELQRRLERQLVSASHASAVAQRSAEEEAAQLRARLASAQGALISACTRLEQRPATLPDSDHILLARSSTWMTPQLSPKASASPCPIGACTNLRCSSQSAVQCNLASLSEHGVIDDAWTSFVRIPSGEGSGQVQMDRIVRLNST